MRGAKRKERIERERHYEKRQRDEKCLKPEKTRQTKCLMVILKKSPLDALFVRTFRILPVFSIIYLIRIRIFGSRKLTQN